MPRFGRRPSLVGQSHTQESLSTTGSLAVGGWPHGSVPLTSWAPERTRRLTVSPYLTVVRAFDREVLIENSTGTRVELLLEHEFSDLSRWR